MPIRYELAYGGAYPAPASSAGEGEAASASTPAPAPAPQPALVVYAPNPSGTGFFDERAMDTSVEYRAPQWQPHEQPVTAFNREVALTGFGPVARPWTSRLRYAGTYDEAWERAMRDDVARGLPADYPKDFDPRFFQCAHPALITPSYLEGDEEIVLTGLMPGPGPFTVALPGVRAVAGLVDGAENGYRDALHLDTVHLDLDAATVSLCWRLTLDQAWDIRSAMIVLMEVT
ncbi:DUF2169 domain-containing protein [Chondromyces apiculatus]|uniref:DUF2169 domain-containing protein n=1 Tax=Chondromyces apiculatus DSM 436 TaxID=1192034 RepID=A0A017TGN4_9BACT|nr:DUF2169 domain-containing protein [Chondromyces apiculatus]EYF08042.1 Hypothetical protein CAP_5802 [Chondromyces apiculatus DSM 436]